MNMSNNNCHGCYFPKQDIIHSLLFFFFKLWLLFSVFLQNLKTISLGQRALHRVGMVMTFVFSNGEKQLCCCKAEFYVLKLYIDI